jgi:hypothetical protein
MKLRNAHNVWLFLGLFTAIAISGLAQWRRPGAWANPGLNLTDEQLAKIQNVRLAFQERIMPFRLQWEKAQLNLDSMTLKGAAQKDIDSAYEALDRIEVEFEKAYQDHWNEVRNLLDEEQRILFDRFGGLGMGPGWVRGLNPRRGMGPGMGRGFGPAWGPGMRRGFRSGWGPGMGPGFGRSWGRGLGRGYFCPWFRWR